MTTFGWLVARLRGRRPDPEHVARAIEAAEDALERVEVIERRMDEFEEKVGIVRERARRVGP